MSVNSESKAAQIEAVLEHCYIFVDKSIAVEAVQMAAPQISAINGGFFICVNNNKRLAVLGDALLAKILCAAWIEGHDGHGNPLTLNHWTTLRLDISANDKLAQRGFNIGLDRCVITDVGNPRVTSKMMATTFAALIGAVYQDGGDEAVNTVVVKLGLLNHDLLTIRFAASPGRGNQSNPNSPL